MFEKDNKHIIDILFVIALFCLFVLSAIFLITIGANIYSKTMANMDTNFNSRTAIAYITERVRQSDENDSIDIGNFEDCPSLIIYSTKGDKDYITYIYEYEGELRELTVRSDVELSPKAGQSIIEVQEFTLEYVSENLVKCSITMEDNENCDFLVTLHTKVS